MTASQKSRIAIVTGGGSGIGLAIGRRLAADGNPVALFDRDGDSAKAAAAQIESEGGTAIGVPVDVTDRAAIDAGVDEVKTRLGAPQILVNSAGVTIAGPALEVTREVWDTVHAVNLTGTFDCCQAVLPHMIDSGWGRIVNISSSSAHSGVAGMSAYVSSKSAVIGLTKSLALEFSKHGITVNTIPPGFIDTPMMRDHAGQGLISVEDQIARTPVGRVGTAEDIATTTSFLVSDGASYITGQVIGVNGGRNT
ncbi:SDR family NAD(P)-dependent oxidoreductase [Rhodococcus artemisiae]|uniref:3-oxoacyl-[acyl-carrier-protein] reductase MabA n=1 Tax=Rhodococcus artemisiae TaxID=714159 RepID=A0ABU7LFI0_9NOCA|nr:SDR family NAD(P)-dependent oxidoreductase [Rhodococcus artemisiae]MEE2060324.1 SDR family NAD(P)-dependent oxidoreductase [Rhodococcus artemisiae]